MFNFLKKFKQKKSMHISFEEIPAFIEEHTKKTSKVNYSSFFSNIKQLLENLKVKVKSLENAQLRNNKIDKKSIQLMQGNREAYIKRVYFFLDNFELPKEHDLDTLIDFVDNYKLVIEKFNKNTERAFYVLKDFLGSEVGAIAQILKKLDTQFVMLHKSLNEESSILTNQIYKTLSEIKEIESKKETIVIESKKVQENIALVSDEIKKLIRNLEILKKGESYNNIKDLTEEKNKIIEQKKLISTSFNEKISKLNYLAYKSGNSLLKKYIEDSILALDHDRELKIYSVLQNNKDVAKEVKNSQETLALIDLMDLKFFRSFRSEYEELQNKIREISSKIRNSSVIRDISEKEYKKDHLVQKIERYKRELESYSKAKLKYNSSELKKQIVEDLTKLTGIQVILNN